MTEFEQDVIRAIQVFLTSIRTAAQRAAVQGVESAFARVSNEANQMDETVAAAGDDTPRSDRRLHCGTLTPSERSAVVARAVAAIREHPGSTTAQLGQALGIRSERLRPYLQKLADDGAIRIEESQLGGLRRRAYFAVEHVNGHAEDTIAPAGATA